MSLSLIPNIHQSNITTTLPDFTPSVEFPEIQDLTRKSKQFIEKISGSSWKSLSEPEEICSELNDLVTKIQSLITEIQHKEEGNNFISFITARLGMGPFCLIRNNLQVVSNSLREYWESYLNRCKQIVERVVASGAQISALQMYKRLRQVAPGEVGILESLGDFYKEIGRNDEAIDLYNLVQIANSQDSRVAVKKARCLLDLHRPKEALKEISYLAGDKEVELQKIESKIKMSLYIEAIYDLLNQIEAHPKEDIFKTKLIEAYLAFSQKDNGALFRANIPLLLCYYSMLSDYSPMSKTFEDSLAIALDFFDFCVKRSPFTPALFQLPLMSSEKRLTVVEIVIEHLNLIQMRLDRKISEKEAKLKELFGQVEDLSFVDKDEVNILNKGIHTLSCDLLGGGNGEIRVGLRRYSLFYYNLAEQLKFNIQEEHLNVKIVKIFERATTLQKRIFDIIHDFSREASKEVGLRELFQRKSNINRSILDEEQEEDITALDWIGRGNLMNLVGERFVPQANRDSLVAYLDKEGIDLELLFDSILMNVVSNIKTEQITNMKEAVNFLDEKGIKTLSSLKSFIQNPINKRSATIKSN